MKASYMEVDGEEGIKVDSKVAVSGNWKERWQFRRVKWRRQRFFHDFNHGEKTKGQRPLVLNDPNETQRPE